MRIEDLTPERAGPHARVWHGLAAGEARQAGNRGTGNPGGISVGERQAPAVRRLNIEEEKNPKSAERNLPFHQRGGYPD